MVATTCREAEWKGRLLWYATPGVQDQSSVSFCQKCSVSPRVLQRANRRGRPLKTRRGLRYCPCPKRDRKSTRLNSRHVKTSYAVFDLNKKRRQMTQQI